MPQPHRRQQLVYLPNRFRALNPVLHPPILTCPAGEAHTAKYQDPFLLLIRQLTVKEGITAKDRHISAKCQFLA
jgi:hypothetical protein